METLRACGTCWGTVSGLRRKATFLRCPLHPKAPHSAPRHHPLLEAAVPSDLLQRELTWALFSLQVLLSHQPELTWAFLLAHREGREKWDVLGAGPRAGLLPQHTLPLHFLNTLFPFIFPVGWSGQSLSEITGVKLGSHKFEGEEKVAVHCWIGDSTSLCHRGRENDCLWSSAVLHIYCQICCQTI